MRALALFAVGSTAACFGAGPSPTSSADATIVFALHEPPQSSDSNQTCSGDWRYVGAVAFTAGSGYALPLAYEGDNCQSTGQGGSTSTVAVTSFNLAGGDVMGAPGAELTIQSGRPRVAVSPSGMVATAVSVTTMGNNYLTVSLGAQSATISPSSVNNGSFDLRGLVADDDAVWIAAVANPSNGPPVPDPDSPDYPGGSPGSSSASSAFVQVDPTTWTVTTAATVDFDGDYMKQVLVGNPTALYFVVSGQNGDVAEVMAMARGGTATAIGSIPGGLAANVVPVGLAASPGNVAFAAAVMPQDAQPGCWIWLSDGVNPATPVLSTTEFACSDVALDSDHVYFTIVQLDTEGDRLDGVGLGRVTFDGATVETMALELTGYTGARRVHLDGAGNLYAIDPKVIGKLSADALAGRSDFAH